MKFTVKSWVLGLIALIVLFLTPSTAIAQNDSLYYFKPSEVKEIAYRIKSRELLMRDTTLLRGRISILSDKLSNLELLVENKNKALEIEGIKVLTIESDLVALKDYSDKVKGENSELKGRIKLLKYGIPISFSLGILTVVLLQ